MGIFTTNLKNVNRFCCWKSHFFGGNFKLSINPSMLQQRSHLWGLGVSRLGGMFWSRWLWAVQNWDIPEKCSYGDSCRPVLSDFAELENLMGFFLHGNLFDSLRFWSIYKLGRCLPCSFGLCYVSHHILASSDVPAKAWKMCQRAVWSGEAGLFRLVIKWSTWIRWSFGPRVLNPSQTLWANNRNKFHIRFPWCKLSWRLNLPPFAHCPLLEETEQLR